MTRGSSYRNDFLLLLKGSDSELLTAYVPSINGGYDCSLEKARFTGRGEQLILSVGQGGDDGSIEYRIIDFADPKAVKEIFTGSDNAGVAATAEFVPDFRVKLLLQTAALIMNCFPKRKSFMNSVGFMTLTVPFKGVSTPVCRENTFAGCCRYGAGRDFGTVVAAEHQWVKQGRPAWEAGRGVVI